MDRGGAQNKNRNLGKREFVLEISRSFRCIGMKLLPSVPHESLYQSISILSPRMSTPPPFSAKTSISLTLLLSKFEDWPERPDCIQREFCLVNSSKVRDVVGLALIPPLLCAASFEFFLAFLKGCRASLIKSVSPRNHSSEGSPSTRRTFFFNYLRAVLLINVSDHL